MNLVDLEAGAQGYFYGTYLRELGNVALVPALKEGIGQMEKMALGLPPEKLHFAYATGKWTVAQVLVHIIDTERVFQYRALRFARKDQTVLPGFDQDTFVKESNAENRTKEAILEEYLAVRNATITLFNGLTAVQLVRTGTASGISWSVAALGFVISGHQRHHLRILEERYLLS